MPGERAAAANFLERLRMLRRTCNTPLPLWIALFAATCGCSWDRTPPAQVYAPPAPAVALTTIEHPTVDTPSRDDLGAVPPPRTIRNLDDIGYWDLSLEETVRLALINSKVMQDLGGTVVRTPDGITTSLDPSIQETDPRFGVEGALSAFDAQLTSTLTGNNTDRRLNNQFVGQLGFLKGDAGYFDTQIAKRAATGSQFFLRQHVDHEKDNNPGNQFTNGAWNVWYEAEARQPLLQGSGLNFNRIAGPGAAPGVFNGVVIARIRADITIAEFEASLRDFVSNVENTYWDLYYAYRDLDAKRKARDTALETWRRIHANFQAGRRGGEAEKEAQAREQYYRFEADLQDSLAGRPLDGTRTNNGSRPGTFRGLPGVLVNEHRLRLIMGISPNGDRLIRPSDEPSLAAIVFDWSVVSSEALARRAELRRQRWQVKRREMELLASRNFLLPQLDLVGRYRYRGFGDDLIDANRNGNPRFDNAYMDLTSGDFQEWYAGAEFSMPLGFRQAHAGVRNAELRLARERVVLETQERTVLHDLSVAVSEMDRSYVVMQTNYNRWVAARQQVAAVEAAFQDDRVEFIAVLDAQRRLAEAESAQYRSRVEYAVAVKNVNFEKGTLLDYLGVIPAEGPWPDKAYIDAERREQLRGAPHVNRSSAPQVGAGTPAAPFVRLPVIEEVAAP